MEKSYYNISNKGSKKAEVRIYGEIWSYGEGSSRNLSNQLSNLSKTNDEITLRINSGGGSVIEAVAIYNIIKNTDAKITAVIEGIAASAMSFIIMACDKVVMGKATRIMTHKMSGGSYGTAKQMRDVADMMDSWESDIYDMYSKKTGKTVEEVKSQYFIEGKDVWISPSQALKDGLIDEIQDGVVLDDAPSNSFNNVNNVWQHFDTHISNHTKQNQKQKTIEMKKVIAKLGLAENATEDEVCAAIDAQAKPATPSNSAEHDVALANRLEALENERAEALVNSAVTAGKVTAEKKPTWLAMAKGNFEQTKEAIESLPGKVDVNALINANGTPSVDNRSNWDATKYLQEDPEGFAKMETEDPVKFKAIIDKTYN